MKRRKKECKECANEKQVIGIVVNQLTKAMDAASAGPVGVEGVPVILAHTSNGHFYIQVICVKMERCNNVHCKKCECKPIHFKLEVRQTEGSGEVAKEHEEEAVNGLQDLVEKALVAMRLDYMIGR